MSRVRPAQEAHDQAADRAAEARRGVAEAARRGERYCPLDPAHRQPGTAAAAAGNTDTGAQPWAEADADADT
jgi:hypothetical protein